MAHIDILGSIYDLRNRAVADVGAGEGTFSRQMDQAGAKVSAVEIDQAKVDKARANLPESISMMVGRAEQLPLEDNSQDAACFFFSFHHVPIEVQDTALEEVKRVLKPEGRFHVVEPFPYGSMFEVVRMVEDETRVRTHSHNLLGGLEERGGFKLIARKDYTLSREYPDFGSLVDKIVRPDPDRLKNFLTVEHQMEEKFYQVVDTNDGRKVLHQPCSAYHFEVSG